jgi:hypothetical protein
MRSREAAHTPDIYGPAAAAVAHTVGGDWLR